MKKKKMKKKESSFCPPFLSFVVAVLVTDVPGNRGEKAWGFAGREK